MVDLVLTAAQIRSAPSAVRVWVRNLLAAELGLPLEPQEETARTLAECTVNEAAQILERIQNDYLACQLFFELGRERIPGRAPAASAHRTALEEIMHHVRLTDVDHLAAGLDEIGRAFRAIRGDADALLFAFDQQGGCYVHETTRRSIRALWQALVTSRLGATAPAVSPVMPAGLPLATKAVPRPSAVEGA